MKKTSLMIKYILMSLILGSLFFIDLVSLKKKISSLLKNFINYCIEVSKKKKVKNFLLCLFKLKWNLKNI